MSLKPATHRVHFATTLTADFLAELDDAEHVRNAEHSTRMKRDTAQKRDLNRMKRAAKPARA